ncbi:sulfurtransferase [Bacillus marinisedimentorum]|uniref:sulfurtransferase n=1 Tax=Bacillus marinisedimentorum TaxID=1821260 RepID=UPI0007DEBADD|nr:rhodanese-like domain-containing protein [Bacillus marinisedimentorum]
MNKQVAASLIALAVFVIGFFTYDYFTGIKAQEVNVSAQQEKINEYSNPESFITPEQLKKLQEDASKDVVVIGAMKSKDKAIPGSFVLWRDDYQGSEGHEYGGMASPKEKMEDMLSSFGVTKNTTIVTYAANDQHDSARLFWQLKMLGHKDVRFLDGGINVWIGEGYETAEAAQPGDRPKTEYKAPDFNEEAFNADVDEVASAVENNDEFYLLDTRSESEESGSDTKKGAYGPGKIKGSTWVEYSQATSEEGTLKSKEELEDLYGEIIESNKEVISYCQSGVRSAYTWLVLTQALGYERVQNYDGSWIEWSYNSYEQGDEGIKSKVENGKF